MFNHLDGKEIFCFFFIGISIVLYILLMYLSYTSIQKEGKKLKIDLSIGRFIGNIIEATNIGFNK
jgi:hypothetical protein